MFTGHKSSFLLFPLFGILALAFYVHLKTQPLIVTGGTLQITALLYADQKPNSKSEDMISRFTCGEPYCVGKIVENVLTREFLRHTGKNLKVNVEFARPIKESLIEIHQPEAYFDGILLLSSLWKEFRQRKKSFFNSDVRLFINLVSKDPYDYTERSLGSAGGRVGFIEWDQSPRPNNFMWNVTKILHEVGHVLGAIDQYLPSGKTIFPGGYVEPEKGERSLQTYVAIMSGRRPNARGVSAEARTINELCFSRESAEFMSWVR